MLKLFSIALNMDTEFSVVGVANIETKEVKFQGHLNGVPFVESDDYEEVSETVMERVGASKPSHLELLS